MPFWFELLNEYGAPVLELGCGTGKLTIPIAEAGFQIVGIDLSEGMLEHANKKVSNLNIPVQFLSGNMSDFSLSQEFRTIIFPSNNLAHLMNYREAEACFTKVHNHLKDDGAFIIDAFVPSLSILSKSSEEEEVISRYKDPDGDGEVEVLGRAVYETDTQIRRVTTLQKFPNKEPVQGHLDMRMYFPQEVESLLDHCDFDIVNKFGSYGFDPFSSGSVKQLIVASGKSLLSIVVKCSIDSPRKRKCGVSSCFS